MPIRIKSSSNCPSGEYYSIFCNSSISNYPKGKRQILTFLILEEDREKPKYNNRGEKYYAVAVCNQSSGENPKSKVHKILKAMLLKEEYDPLKSELVLPSLEDFLPHYNNANRVVKIRVRIVGTEKKASVVSHIQRPRDNIWECIEGNFEGKYNKATDPENLYQKLVSKLSKRQKEHCNNSFFQTYLSKSFSYIDEKGKFIEKVNYETMSSGSINKHKKLLKFLEEEDLNILFPHLKYL